MVYESKEGHIPSAFSILDILYVLYKKILKFDSKNPEWKKRDYFILSKGHGCLALYQILSLEGFFSKEKLKTFCKFDSILGGHPDRNKVPGIEASTGSLGHGLPMGLGIALSLKIQKKSNKVYVLIGDGESEEGTTWECTQIAKNLSLDNLILIVDRNRSQRYSAGFDYNKIWESFGWESVEIDGHDYEAIENSLKKLSGSSSKKPRVIVANTVKGKGSKHMEHNPEWHHKSPDDDNYNELIGSLE